MEPFVHEEVFALQRNPLTGLTCLPVEVTLMVPTTIHDEPASASIVNYQREAVIESFCRWFGGFTETSAQGGWYSETLGKVIREKVLIVSANAEAGKVTRCLPHVIDLARKVAAAMKQECVTIKVDGKLYFVQASRQNA